MTTISSSIILTSNLSIYKYKQFIFKIKITHFLPSLIRSSIIKLDPSIPTFLKVLLSALVLTIYILSFLQRLTQVEYQSKENFKDNMADQIIIIDLVKEEATSEKVESYQDKIVKLEAKAAQMEQEIDGIKEMMTDLKNSSSEKGHSPICTAPPPICESNARSFSHMHSFLPEKAFSSLAETSKDRENGGNGHVLQPESDLVVAENENGNIANLTDVPMYNGIGCPQSHLKAYHDWLACIGQGNEFKLRLFVRTLTGPALMWYAKQDTWKWFIWNDLVKDFVNQYGSSNNTTSRCSSLKRKFMESPQSLKANEPQGNAVESTLELGKMVKTHPQDKGKGVITEESKPPPSAPKIGKSRNFTPLSEPPSIIFERLRSFGIMQSKPAKTPPPHFNPTKCCAFHSGMLGHTTDECHCLKEEIQKLLDNGRVIQGPVPPTQSMWYQPPNVIPIQNFTQVAYPQFANSALPYSQAIQKN